VSDSGDPSADLTLAVACLMNKHTNASAGMLVVYARYRRSFAQLRERHHGVERAGWGASPCAKPGRRRRDVARQYLVHAVAS
jgi:hypothetical protein